MSQQIREHTFTSTLDGSSEPFLLDAPAAGERVPLVVGLHTWSCDRFNQVETMLPFCRDRRWALMLPEFRGPNLDVNPRAPEACASSLAIQDILDSVGAARRLAPIDERNLFLLGGSGGGHTALMMAAHAPDLWRGVSAWVPITDLGAWHAQNPKYAPHIEACCGGPPGHSSRVDEQYRLRSPIGLAERMAAANLSIHHGRADDSVPFSHTVQMVERIEDHGPDRLFYEVFDGGHTIRFDVAFRWFDQLAGQQADTPPATG